MESGQCPGMSKAGLRPALLLLKPEQDFLHFNFANTLSLKSKQKSHSLRSVIISNYLFVVESMNQCYIIIVF